VLTSSKEARDNLAAIDPAADRAAALSREWTAGEALHEISAAAAAPADRACHRAAGAEALAAAVVAAAASVAAAVAEAEEEAGDSHEYIPIINARIFEGDENDLTGN
jgi:hypothetical protein